MPEDEAQQPNNFARFAWIAILVIFMLGFAAFTIKTFVDDRNRNNNTAENTSRDQIADEFKPRGDDETPGQPVADIRGPETSDSPPQVLGSSLNTATSSAQPAFKAYRNDTFRFSATVPADAQITVNDNKVTANGPSGIFWTLTKYDNTTETLESLETQLNGSPSVTSLTRTSLGNISALNFTSPNLQGATGYAFIINGRLYYLVGNFTTPESWQGFNFF